MSAPVLPAKFNGPPLAMPLGVPAGNQTWEVRTVLRTTEPTTGSLLWTLKGPALITSFRPSVIAPATPLVPVPNALEALEVAMQVDQESEVMNQTDQTGGGTPVIGNYVTLGSIGPDQRLWRLYLTAAMPRLSATIRSKVGSAASSGFAVDLLISITCVGWYLDSNGEPINTKVTVQ